MNILKLIEYSVYPRRCELCANVIEMDRVRCESCEQLEDLNHTIYDNSLAFDALVAPFYFESGIRVGIHRFKYRNYDELADSLANEMLKAIRLQYADIEFDAVTFVPLTWIRKLKRGYNQAELLAEVIAKGMGLKCSKLLVKVKNTKTQQGSTASQRKKNLINAFDSSGVDVKGKTILLVDDVKTTGATLSECARVLKKYGAEKVYAVTIAVTKGN